MLRDELTPLDHLELPRAPTGRASDYHTANEFFGLADAWALQAMLHRLRPGRLIEVGGGWSSLVSARLNHERLGGALEFVCIEPYPADFLTEEIEGISRLIVAPVQEVPIDRFLMLEAGDVLFIDTSHVAKTGGDVPYLYHEILPRLRPGVIVHIHDVFLPWDYPEEWVLGGRGWNEQYLVRSFLAFNSTFKVLLGVAWLCRTHPELLRAAIPVLDPVDDGGASLWIRRRS